MTEDLATRLRQVEQEKAALQQTLSLVEDKVQCFIRAYRRWANDQDKGYDSLFDLTAGFVNDIDMLPDPPEEPQP